MKQDNLSAPANRPDNTKPWWRRYLAIPTLLALAILGFLLFFGENSMPRRYSYQRTIDSLQVCLDEQRDSLKYYRELNRRLSTDPELMEQVVREQYHMKRANEDVYTVEK